MRKWFMAVCALAVVCAGTVRVTAAPEGILRVIPSFGGDGIGGGSVTLYRVGDPVEGGFRLTDGLANWIIRGEDAFTTDFPGWILERVPSEGITGEVRGEEGAVFSGLEDGLYLIVQPLAAPGFACFSSFLISIPRAQQREVYAYPRLERISGNPKTGDHPAPIFGAMGIAFSVVALMLLLDRKGK